MAHESHEQIAMKFSGNIDEGKGIDDHSTELLFEMELETKWIILVM